MSCKLKVRKSLVSSGVLNLFYFLVGKYYTKPIDLSIRLFIFFHLTKTFDKTKFYTEKTDFY